MATHKTPLEGFTMVIFENLSVGELIEELKKFDSTLPVWAEGCDCDNAVTSVGLDEVAPHVAHLPAYKDLAPVVLLGVDTNIRRPRKE